MSNSVPFHARRANLHTFLWICNAGNFIWKGRRPTFNASMTHRVTQNHIRKHRKRTGLSQREISLLLGYRNQWQVSRHERSDTIPPLLAALAYQVIFQIPVSIIFAPMHGTVMNTIESNLADFERALIERGTGSPSRAISQKIKWLKDRRK